MEWIEFFFSSILNKVGVIFRRWKVSIKSNLQVVISLNIISPFILAWYRSIIICGMEKDFLEGAISNSTRSIENIWLETGFYNFLRLKKEVFPHIFFT